MVLFSFYKLLVLNLANIWQGNFRVVGARVDFVEHDQGLAPGDTSAYLESFKSREVTIKRPLTVDSGHIQRKLRGQIAMSSCSVASACL
jgi:hypothetical protein